MRSCQWLFGPEQLQDVCNLNRRLVAGADPLPPNEAKHHILTLDRQRRALLQLAETRLTLAYDMVFMVQCMVLSGLLIDMAVLRSAVLLSVSLALGRDPIISQFFEDRSRNQNPCLGLVQFTGTG